jgi:hypothetical protein
MESTTVIIISGVFSLIIAYISGVFSLIIAYITALYKTNLELKKERARGHLNIALQQQYNYLLPFKYCADDFRGRLIHIKKRLSEKGKKHKEMVSRFNQTFDDKVALNWYFCDDVGPQGGYYITSTIYMNCILFYWIKRLQHEYPFIPLKIKAPKESVMDNFRARAKGFRYKDAFINENCEIYSFIKTIKIILGGEHGIPYGLHDSFGDFMFDYTNNRLLNYEEFCRMLISEQNRIKFSPLLRFWGGLVDYKKNVADIRLKKIEDLIAVLEILKCAEIRES